MSRTKLKQWKALVKHHKKMKNARIAELFKLDPQRYNDFHIEFDSVIFDYSKQRISKETVSKLMDLARACDLEGQRDAMFSGKIMNITEHRAVLHTALRAQNTPEIIVDGQNIIPQIKDAFVKMRSFTEEIRAEKRFTHIINIGIGGSDLGPYMVCEALKTFSDRSINVQYVSNVDYSHLAEKLLMADPAKTLFIVTSKTFTTQETMCNARTARRWLQEHLGKDDVSDHFLAATQNIDEAVKFGIHPDNIFPIWDWVGGRYSLWSTIGLSSAISIGFDNFEQLLAGAHALDTHFCTAPLEQNIPVLMAMLGVWHRNFEGYEAYGIMPYDQYLHALPAYMQQLDMESNGKSVTRDGKKITDYKTGPVIMGETGTNGQHAFFQLIHQGTTIIPSDFIFSLKSQNPMPGHQMKLTANAIAQTKALMDGRDNKDPHKVFDGSRPSNTIVFPEITPYYLGMLLALYEHKVFVQGIIWDINSFDQCGVELGKMLAKQILTEFGHDEDTYADDEKAHLDSSTDALISMVQRSS